jgi:hypothetical protein
MATSITRLWVFLFSVLACGGFICVSLEVGGGKQFWRQKKHLVFFSLVFRIRIRIDLALRIRIRIGNAEPDLDPGTIIFTKINK